MSVRRGRRAANSKRRSSVASWVANHESGTYAEWDGDGWGGDFSSGPGTYAKSIDTAHAHTGTYSLKMETDTTLGQAGQRNFRWAINAAGDDLPVHAFYTCWYYFDQVYAPVGGDWNIMQWKTKRDSFGSNDPDWCIGVYNQAASMQLYTFDFHLGSNHGAFSPIGSLTINTWHELKVEYLRSGAADGLVRAWLDGVLFADLGGVVTRWPTSELGHFDTWSINNYTAENVPDASVIWADDASIVAA